MNKLYIIVLLLIFISGVNGYAQIARYKLQPTDVITVTVHGHSDLTTKTRVSADGYISFPLLGKVSVEGLTVQELEDKLKTLLEKDYLVNAPVVVFIEEYHPRQVSVIGEVNTPGKFNMPDEKDMTLLEAIAMAEGFTKDALLTKIKIIRITGGQRQTIVVNVKEMIKKDEEEKDLVLEPNDIIVVPESFF